MVQKIVTYPLHKLAHSSLEFLSCYLVEVASEIRPTLQRPRRRKDSHMSHYTHHLL